MFFSSKRGNTPQTYNRKVRSLFTVYTVGCNLFLTIVAIISTIMLCKSKAENILHTDTNEYVGKVNSWLSEYTATLNSIGDSIAFNPTIPEAELKDVLNSLGEKEAYKLISAIYVAVDGNKIISPSSKIYSGDSAFTSQEWYTKAIESPDTVFVTNPIYEDGDVYITFSKSFKSEDTTRVLAIDVSLDSIAKFTHLNKSDKSYCFLVDDNYNLLSHVAQKYVIGGSDTATLDKVANNTYKDLYKLACKSSTKFEQLKDYDGVKKIGHVLPVNYNWKIVGVMPYSDSYSALYIILIVQIIAVIANIIVLNTAVSNKISRWFLPLLSISNKVECLSNGDLSVDFDETVVSFEIDALTTALNKTINNLNLYINDIKDVLRSISDSKLNVSTSDSYEGDFNEIKESLDHIIDNLNSIFGELNDTAFAVSYNAEHMQASSEELAAGVTEQSGYIKEMFDSIDKLSVLIKTTANNSVKASQMADKSAILLSAENEYMAELLNSMDEIKASSKQIGAIINTINEIADQTDLLALNASIEASRAGEAGKSFAVIAGEVGSLARDSAEAVNTITELITNSTKAVDKGVEIANKTAEHLSEAISYSNDAKTMVDEISSATSLQSDEISSINLHISQISGVTENNQAAAQENFAISDEASNQAQHLKAMVDKFDFKSTNDENTDNNDEKNNNDSLDNEEQDVESDIEF